jgi:hypothetical protein
MALDSVIPNWHFHRAGDWFSWTVNNLKVFTWCEILFFEKETIRNMPVLTSAGGQFFSNVISHYLLYCKFNSTSN